MDISQLALTRVDELERRVVALGQNKNTLKVFEFCNDKLNQYVVTSDFTYSFTPFTPVEKSTLTLVLNMNLNYLKNTLVNISFFCNNAKIVSQKQQIDGKFTLFLTKTITIYKTEPVTISVNFKAEEQEFTLEKYSLTVIGNFMSLPLGITPISSADRFNKDEVTVEPYKPPKQEPTTPDEPPIEDIEEASSFLLLSATVMLVDDKKQLTANEIKSYSQLS